MSAMLPHRLIGAGAAALWAALSASGATIAPELEAGIDGGRSQNVIIHVQGGADTKLALGPVSGEAERRRLAEVERILTDVLAEIEAAAAPDELVVSRNFLLQPAFAAEVGPDVLRTLATHPRIRWIEPDRGWTLATLEGLELIGADILHDLGIAGEGAAIAVIDSGIDYLHPTLGNGQIPNAKVVHGVDLADGDDDPMDCSGHGTAVASVAAGSTYQWSPGRRFAGGVAPAAKILAYKVTSDDGCRVAATSAVVAAIEDAVLRREGGDYRLAAINISLGGGAFEGPCDADNAAYAEAVRTAVESGIVVVAAAGNGGEPSSLSVPACLGDAIAVGSVWDADPSWIGYSFCLDPECTRFCDDSFRWQGAVSCYSNSSPFLDLLAPSEYLRAAAKDGVMVDFGGTSGAAAYVAGAVALLSEAVPNLSPTATRHLLATSGAPKMDDKNGLVRPMVDLAAAIEAASRVAVTQDHGLLIAPRADSPTRSELRFDHPGPIGSMRVMVDLAHPDPDQLRLVLTAPDGTTVVLHDGAELPAAAGAAGQGIAATYPDDVEPVESLGVFAGRSPTGVWDLTIFNELDGATPGAPATLIGWSLALETPDQPLAAQTSLVFPVVAHSAGAHGTSWRSDVRLFNPIGDVDARVRLFLVDSPGQELVESRQTDVIVPHGTVVGLDEVVQRRFGLDDATGTLLVEDPTGAVRHGSSRTYTEAESGAYGQYIPSAPDGAPSTGAGEPPLVVLPVLGDDHRVNMGFTEVSGASATVAISLIDAESGAATGPSTFHSISRFANLQLNDILSRAGPGTADNAYAEITVVQGNGRIVAYASVIDNRTGDAVFISGVKATVTASLLIPVVASAEGQLGTSWQSDLRVLNHGSFSVHVDAELRLHGGFGLPPVVRGFELGSGEAIFIDDVVGSFFALDDIVASLRLVPREGPAALFATSRTANHSPSGTYGQYVPALLDGEGLVQTGAILHVSKTSASRTNVGIVETGGGHVHLVVRLTDRFGRTLGSPIPLSLSPLDSTQLNDIFSVVGAEAHEHARVEVERTAGTGRFFAYGSVVDAVSGDAIFVPVVAVETSLTN